MVRQAVGSSPLLKPLDPRAPGIQSRRPSAVVFFEVAINYRRKESHLLLETFLAMIAAVQCLCDRLCHACTECPWFYDPAPSSWPYSIRSPEMTDGMAVPKDRQVFQFPVRWFLRGRQDIEAEMCLQPIKQLLRENRTFWAHKTCLRKGTRTLGGYS